MRTQEQRDAAKARREKRKLKKQQALQASIAIDAPLLPVEVPTMMNDRQIIDEIRRLEIPSRYWYEDLTYDQKKEVLSDIKRRIEECDETTSLSTMIFDSIYKLKNQGVIVRGAGVIGLPEGSDELERKKDRREQRKLRRKLEAENSRETKNKNNPLQVSGNVVRCNHGSKNRIKNNEENTMILINEKTNTTLRLKVRTKGAPNYAETGDNRSITIDGKKFNLVLNPKKENNNSKRVGISFNNKWYFVDDADAHKFVKGLKGTTAFTQKKAAEKAEPKKAAKGNGKAAEKVPVKKGKKAAPKKAAKKATVEVESAEAAT